MDIEQINSRTKYLARGVAARCKGVSLDLIEDIITVGLLDGWCIGQAEIIAEDMVRGFVKLHPVDGDLLIYTTDPANPPDCATVEAFQEALKANGATVTVACVTPPERLGLSPDQPKRGF